MAVTVPHGSLREWGFTPRWSSGFTSKQLLRTTARPVTVADQWCGRDLRDSPTRAGSPLSQDAPALTRDVGEGQLEERTRDLGSGPHPAPQPAWLYWRQAPSWDQLPARWCPPPSARWGRGRCQIRKSCPALKKETFINNLNNNNTADLNGHTLEAYRMVRKEAGAWPQSSRGPGAGLLQETCPARGRGGLCTEDSPRGRGYVHGE